MYQNTLYIYSISPFLYRKSSQQRRKCVQMSMSSKYWQDHALIFIIVFISLFVLAAHKKNFKIELDRQIGRQLKRV